MTRVGSGSNRWGVLVRRKGCFVGGHAIHAPAGHSRALRRAIAAGVSSTSFQSRPSSATPTHREQGEQERDDALGPLVAVDFENAESILATGRRVVVERNPEAIRAEEPVERLAHPRQVSAIAGGVVGRAKRQHERRRVDRLLVGDRRARRPERASRRCRSTGDARRQSKSSRETTGYRVPRAARCWSPVRIENLNRASGSSAFS